MEGGNSKITKKSFWIFEEKTLTNLLNSVQNVLDLAGIKLILASFMLMYSIFFRFLT